MNPWILASLVACFVGAWVPAIHTQGTRWGDAKRTESCPCSTAAALCQDSDLGTFQDCCLDYHPHTTLTLLLRAKSYRVQEVSGSCNLPAVIFYFRRIGRMVCGNPWDIRVQKAKRILERRAAQRSNYNNGLTLPGFLAERKKLNTGTARLPLSKLKDLSSNSSSKRNASLS